MEKEKKPIKYYYPKCDTGLTNEQVNERIQDKLTNKTEVAVGKSYFDIIMDNVFSFFNVLLFIIAGFMIYAGYYSGLFFLAVLVPNMAIGLYEDIKARILLSKLRILTQPKVNAVRNGKIIEIDSKSIVLDDIVALNGGSQICADGIVEFGQLFVNESLLTGESKSVIKNVGDKVFAGSFVTSGNARMHVTNIGNDNYASSLQKAANKFKRSPSQILSSLNNLFKVIGTIVVVMAVATIAIYITQGNFKTIEATKESIGFISGSMVSMIPSGLYLLTSVALASAVISLAKKKAQVQDFYSVEMLARTDTLCIDKTGTITDGTMEFKKLLLVGGYSEVQVEQIVSNILIATKDDNFTAKALRKHFNLELNTEIVKSTPFDSERKYSAATFLGNRTFVIGAPEFLKLQNKQGVLHRVNEYTSLGYRAIVLAEGNPDGTTYNGCELVPLAIIVLQDHIKDDALKTFSWFQDNGVKIKVISGDNALTASEVARQAGITDANDYISLEGMSIEEVKNIADKYTVFGRVTPEQKEAIVIALKEHGKTVAMTGDGVNDILALKRADCSIAMASGADAARNVSHIVLLDSDFGRLPSVVAEGRRVINNLQRTCSLFLSKTIFAFVLSLGFLLTSLILKDPNIKYPFLTNSMYLWEILGIGMPAFFLALEKNNEQIKHTFISNVLKKAIPGAVTAILGVVIVYVLFILQANNLFTGVMPDEVCTSTSMCASSISVLVYSTVSMAVLFKVCSPFDKYRKIICGIFIFLFVGTVVGCALFTTFTGNNNILMIDFNSLSPINYLTYAVVSCVLIALYFAITYTIDVSKGDVSDDQD